MIKYGGDNLVADLPSPMIQEMTIDANNTYNRKIERFVNRIRLIKFD